MLKKGALVKKKYRSILVMALLGWIVCLEGEMVDSILSGIYLDSDAVAAVGLIEPIYSIVYFFSIITAVGAAIMYSKELGANNKEKSDKIAGMSVFISIIMGILMAAILIVVKPYVLDFYGCNEIITAYASKYYDAFIYVAIVYPPLWSIYNIITFDGDETLIFLSDASVAIIHTVLAFIFVQTKGIEGICIGLVLGQVVGLVILIPHFFKKSNSIHLKFHFSFKDLFEMIKISSPKSSIYLYSALIAAIMNVVVIKAIGDEYLAAFAVVSTTLNVANAFECFMASGSPFVSISFGEKNPESIKDTMIMVGKGGVLVAIIFTIALFFAAPIWPELYGIEDPVIAQAAIFAGRVVPLGFIVTSFSSIATSYYPIVDKTFVGNLVGMSYMFIGPLVIAIPLTFLFGFKGLSIGYALTSTFAMLVLVIYVLSKKELKNGPLLLKRSDERYYHADIEVSNDGIKELLENLAEFFSSEKVEDRLINQIIMVVEDSLEYTLDKNKKKVIADIEALVADDHVRMMIRDNGEIFDMLKDNEDARSFRSYVLDRILVSASRKYYTTAISFNRNTYYWDR